MSAGGTGSLAAGGRGPGGDADPIRGFKWGYIFATQSMVYGMRTQWILGRPRRGLRHAAYRAAAANEHEVGTISGWLGGLASLASPGCRSFCSRATAGVTLERALRAFTRWSRHADGRERG